MGSKGLALLLEAPCKPYILHVAHSGAASTAAAAAAAALLLPQSPARCEASSGGWYAGVPEPFPSAAFEGDENDRSFIMDKQFRESGTVLSTIADGRGGQSYTKVPIADPQCTARRFPATGTHSKVDERRMHPLRAMCRFCTVIHRTVQRSCSGSEQVPSCNVASASPRGP